MIRYYAVSGEARSVVLAQSKKYFPNETGGILVGKVTDDCVQIAYATKAGPGATQSPDRFQRDGEYSQGKLDAIVSESNGEFDYVGEWHSHPLRVPVSAIDVRSMRWIINNSNYATETPILLLCVRHSLANWRLHCLLFIENRIMTLEEALQIQVKMVEERDEGEPAEEMARR